MNILGIETSCDETAAAVVKDGHEVLTNIVHTQIPLHQPYGGVVPELASRAHVEKIKEVISAALSCGQECPQPLHVDAVAVTYGPGLSPALLVGLNAAKGLAMSLGVPLIAINHIEAHLHTPFLYDSGALGDCPLPPDLNARYLGLAISGGHTNWIDIPRYGEYHTIGRTLDDAAGEAFDKASKLLGLGYPGGPKLDKMAKEYIAEHELQIPNSQFLKSAPLIAFPQGKPREGVTALAGLPADLCVSFSGLKTALLRYVQQHHDLDIPQVVTSYQEAIVQSVADRTQNALRHHNYQAMIVGGGVSLNSRLRAVLAEVCAKNNIPLLMAKPKYCGDNGAMIAGLAYYRKNIMGDAAMRVDATPSLEIG